MPSATTVFIEKPMRICAMFERPLRRHGRSG
jgi:hypothetical protein